MLIAYGWPRILPISDSREALVCLKVYEDLLLLVSAGRIQLWNVAQHKVKLGDYSSSSDEEGENLYAVWKADRKTVAVLTAACFLCLYEITVSNDKLSFGTEVNNQVNRVHIERYACFKIVLPGQAVTAFASDSTAILLGLSDGSVQCMSWTGESIGNVKLLDDGVPLSGLALENGTPEMSSRAIVHLEISLQLQLLVAIFRDGRLLQCSTSRGGLHHVHGIVLDKWASAKDAVCASIGHQLQLLAVGSRRGTVELFNLADNLSQMRTISLFDWGYSVEDTGPINCISWTPDNSALAVGWQKRGLSVWSVSGCRLMCSIRQGSPSTANSPVLSGWGSSRNEPMVNGVGHVVWAGQGFSLIAAETKKPSTLLEFPFVKNTLKRCVSGSSHVLDILYGEDRLLIVKFDEEEELKLQHLVLPQTYISAAWPVKYAAINEDGTYLAIAGTQGVILYDVSTKKWRVFGDVMQERQIRCCGLVWLGKVVIVCNHREANNTFELSLYPRYHLDESSLLCRKLLPGKPLGIDVWRDYILVAFAPFDVQVFHVNMEGELSPFKVPVVQLNTVRELSIVSVKRHPVAMQILPISLSSKEETPFSQQPVRAMILRSDGELSILDMDQGSERSLISGIERFWLTSGHPEVTGLAEEVSWWGYGHQGMQVWYPSSTLKDENTELDPEIDFDREVYPLTICPSAGVVVGVSQRLSISPCSALPSFEPAPQVQTILPGLLHHLLQRSKKDEALQLAKLSANTSHFSHSLEWLLFTVFDAAISGQNHSKKGSRERVLLQQACDLIRNFSEFADVVVSVARKTDGRHWPVLFAAAGDSTRLFEECFERKSFHTATCYILVIAKLEGPSVSQNVALRLLQATLDDYMYELAGELVQFLLRIGRDFESDSKELKSSHSPLTSFFLRLPSSNPRRVSTESDVLTSTVRKILEDHAVDLMSRRELPDLVAFVRETQFNLTRFLQTERGRAGARLDDFASALRTVNTKLPMDVLQSRLDAEFLLAHMRTAGFREWIVVLATLLRRAELLVELFRGDARLWQAYRRALDEFGEFHGFLSELEDAVSSRTATATVR